MVSLQPREVKVIRATSEITDKNILRVAAYCRVSTDSDDQANSFIAQVKYYNDFIRLSDACETDYKEMMNFAEQLEDLINFKIKEVTFTEIGYGSNITFRTDRLGHINVRGQIYGNAMTHSMEFEFITDQTVFSAFIAALKAL